MHTTLSITHLYKSPIQVHKTPYCQETPQLIGIPSHTTREIHVLITMTHHFSNIFLIELWQEPCFVRLTNIPPFDFTALCSNTSTVSIWQLDLKIVIQTHYITFQDINLQPYFKIACVKSVLWHALISSVVNVSLSGRSWGYWTASNNFKCYSMLPYCVRFLWLDINIHDDVIKWKHFPRYGPFVRGIHRSPVNCPHKGQWCGAVMFSLICAWTNGWVNNQDTSDFRSQSHSLWCNCNFELIEWCIYASVN